MARVRPAHLIVGVVLLLLFVGNVVLTHNIFTEPYPGHNDFLPHWQGTYSFWREGISPYDDQTTLKTQMQMFGRPAEPGEDPNPFAYPFFYTYFLIPLTYFTYPWASAVWMVILEVCLIASMLLLLDLYQWRPKPWLLACLLVWVLLVYYAGRGLVLGQVSLAICLLQVLVLWLVVRGHDRAAGVVLAISVLKPQMGFLLVAFLLLWALRARRWQFVGAFVVTFGLLIVTSFVLLPSWLTDWLNIVRLYPQYTAAAFPDSAGSPVWILFGYYLGAGDLVQGAVNLLLIGVLLWSWYEALLRRGEPAWLWAVAVTLTVTNLVAFRTATPNFTVFLIPTVFYFRHIARRGRRGSLWVALVLLAGLVLPWAQFLITIQGRGDSEHGSMLVTMPFFFLILLVFTRTLCWRAEPVIAPADAARQAAP